MELVLFESSSSECTPPAFIISLMYSFQEKLTIAKSISLDTKEYWQAEFKHFNILTEMDKERNKKLVLRVGWRHSLDRLWQYSRQQQLVRKPQRLTF